MTREVWRSIPLFDAYEVSNRGRVRRVKRGPNGAPCKELKSWMGFGGRLYVSLRADGQTHTFTVSALQASAFGRRRRQAREAKSA